MLKKINYFWHGSYEWKEPLERGNGFKRKYYLEIWELILKKMLDASSEPFTKDIKFVIQIKHN